MGGMKSQRAEVGCPRSHSKSGRDPRFSNPKTFAKRQRLQVALSPNDLEIWVSDYVQYYKLMIK